MEIEKYIEKINKIEERVTLSISLLDIAKSYCDCHFDKAGEISSLGTVIGLVLREQRELADYIDAIL